MMTWLQVKVSLVSDVNPYLMIPRYSFSSWFKFVIGGIRPWQNLENFWVAPLLMNIALTYELFMHFTFYSVF
jgi:hypothetical protein